MIFKRLKFTLLISESFFLVSALFTPNTRRISQNGKRANQVKTAQSAKTLAKDMLG